MSRPPDTAEPIVRTFIECSQIISLTRRDVEEIEKVLKGPPFEVPCHCGHCVLQYRTQEEQNQIHLGYIGHRNKQQTIALAQTYREAMFRDLEVLRENIVRFGNRIQKRWRRKRPSERRDWLLQARPSMYAHQNPMLVLATPPPPAKKILAQRRSFRPVLLLPYLNVEGLSGDSARLIGLLHHRAVNKPQDWVLFDDKQMQIAWDLGYLADRSAPGCICMYGDKYGEWKPFDQSEVHRGDAFGSPRALLVLEAQKYLIEFLRDMTRIILHGSETSDVEGPHDCRIQDSAACDKWMKFIESGPRTDPTQPWLSCARTLSDQPYSTPPTCNIDELIEIAETQTAAAEDELWLLQTHPEYFYKKASQFRKQWVGNGLRNTRSTLR